MDVQELLEIVLRKDASDLHLIPGMSPTIRVDGELIPLTTYPSLSQAEVEALTFQLTRPEQKELLLVNKEIDFSFAYGEFARFRVNAYYQKGALSAALRLIPIKVRGIDELNLPKICHVFTRI